MWRTALSGLLLAAGVAGGCARGAITSDDLGAGTDADAAVGEVDAGPADAGPTDAALMEPPDEARPADLTPPPRRAPPRAEQAYGWDATARRLVAFGGDDGARVGAVRVPRYHDDTLVFDFATVSWSPSAARGPRARGRAAFAMDTRVRRLLVSMGRDRPAQAAPADPFTLLDDTWAYDVVGDAWSKVAAGPGPAARSGAAAVHDAARDRLVVFGGDLGAAFDGRDRALSDETWQLAGTTWQRVPVKGAVPPARALAGVALDSRRNRMVIFGGCCDGTAPLGDAWALDLTTDTWTRLAETGDGPSARAGASVAYDAGNDRVAIFGGHDQHLGFVNDVWSLDGEGTFLEHHRGDSIDNPVPGCAGDPDDRPYDFVVVDFYAPERRAAAMLVATGGPLPLLLAGGEGECAQLDDAWQFDAGQWTPRITPLHGAACLRRNERCPCYCR